MTQVISTDDTRLCSRVRRIGEGILIRVPTVGEVISDGGRYYGTAAMLAATPFDMMVQLDDAGVDFTAISEFQLFWFVLLASPPERIESVFIDLDVGHFKLTKVEKDEDEVLVNDVTGVKIDKFTYELIADEIRSILCIEKNKKKAANKAAKKFLLERARSKAKRENGGTSDRYVESLIIALVNSPEFKYDFDGCLKLNIYAFNASVRQILKRVNYNQVMAGVYAGTIKSDSVNFGSLNWLP